MADLLSLLNQTDLISTNQPLYQLLKALINQGSVATVSNPNNTEAVNIDTRNAPFDIYLATAIKPGKFYIISDIYGNASSNNITLVGTVDGVVDPVINTDYATFRVYATTNGFSQW